MKDMVKERKVKKYRNAKKKEKDRKKKRNGKVKEIINNKRKRESD